MNASVCNHGHTLSHGLSAWSFCYKPTSTICNVMSQIPTQVASLFPSQKLIILSNIVTFDFMVRPKRKIKGGDLPLFYLRYILY